MCNSLQLLPWGRLPATTEVHRRFRQKFENNSKGWGWAILRVWIPDIREVCKFLLMYFSQEVHQAFSSMLAGEVDGSPAETPLRPYLLCKTNALILLGKMGLEAILCSWVWGKEKKLYSWGQGRHSIQPSPRSGGGARPLWGHASSPRCTVGPWLSLSGGLKNTSVSASLTSTLSNVKEKEHQNTHGRNTFSGRERFSLEARQREDPIPSKEQTLKNTLKKQGETTYDWNRFVVVGVFFSQYKILYLFFWSLVLPHHVLSVNFLVIACMCFHSFIVHLPMSLCFRCSPYKSTSPVVDPYCVDIL